MSPNKFPKGEENFNRWLVDEYFKHGTVDEVFRENKYSLPVSYANYQRILDKWGVVKKGGPDNKLTEALEFLSHLANDTVSVEKLYKKMPPSFQTSVSTLHRILSYVKDGITRRVGCALIITPYNENKKILIGRDISTPRIELGKPYGSYSLPMGYSRKRDSRKVSITRILQQEVFTGKVVDKSFPISVIKEEPTPFLYLDIADVRVSVYHIQLEKELSQIKCFSSYKLKDFKFVAVDEILKDKNINLRVGVRESVMGYLKYLNLLKRNLMANPLQAQSVLNKELAEVIVDY